MALCAFVGDELTALGFRLAGVDCHCPAPGEAANLIRRLRGETGLLLVTAELAAALPPGLLAPPRSGAPPLVLLVPDAQGRVPVADLAGPIRRQLGMSE